MGNVGWPIMAIRSPDLENEFAEHTSGYVGPEVTEVEIRGSERDTKCKETSFEVANFGVAKQKTSVR